MNTKTTSRAFTLTNFSLVNQGGNCLCKFDIEIPGVGVLLGVALIKKQNTDGFWVAMQSRTYESASGQRHYAPTGRLDPALADEIVKQAARLYQATKSD